MGIKKYEIKSTYANFDKKQDFEAKYYLEFDEDKFIGCGGEYFDPEIEKWITIKDAEKKVRDIISKKGMRYVFLENKKLYDLKS